MDIHLPLQPSRSGRASSKAAALAVLATAQLVIALDYSIVNVALPDIGRSLGFTGGTVQWVISAYTLTFGGFLLLGGRAADLLGRRRMFMAALSLFDLAGALLVTLGAMAIVDSLVSAPTQGWTSVRTLVGGAIGLVLLAAFVVVELRSRSPLMPLRLLRIRTVRGGVLVTAAFMSSFGLQLFFLTLYLQQGLGQAPLKAGLSFLPLVLSVVAGTQVGGRLVGRVGISRTLAAGMTFGAVGLALYLRLPATPSLAILLPGMIVAGLGQGVAFTTMYVAAGTGVARGEQGVASALAATALLGAAVALFVIGPGERTRHRRRQPEPECCPEEPVRQAAA